MPLKVLRGGFRNGFFKFWVVVSMLFCTTSVHIFCHVKLQFTSSAVYHFSPHPLSWTFSVHVFCSDVPLNSRQVCTTSVQTSMYPFSSHEDVPLNLRLSVSSSFRGFLVLADTGNKYMGLSI